MSRGHESGIQALAVGPWPTGAPKKMRRTLRMTLALAAALALSGALAQVQEGTRAIVEVVDGDTIKADIPAGNAPKIGDIVTVMRDAGGRTVPVGVWKITHIYLSMVTAVRTDSGASQPAVGMTAIITSPPAPARQNPPPARNARRDDQPSVFVPGADSSGTKGKVTSVRDQHVTIRLDGGAAAAVGDRVEVTFAAGAENLSVGEWRVSSVGANGRIEAEPVEVKSAPQPGYDAMVWTSAGPAGGSGSTEGSGAIPGVHAGAPPSRQPVSATPATPTPADILFMDAERIYYGRGVPQDKARAVPLYEEAAYQGHTLAAERAGNAYLHGDGVPRNYSRAAELLRIAAEAGRPLAQNNYGALFGEGNGVRKDEAAAIAWYRKAAAQGLPLAQSNLCAAYLQGHGVEQNFSEALKFCRLAAGQNLPAAIDQLGWIYQKGLGVDADPSRAVQYYRQAAELGHANGQNNYAYCLANGIGIAPNPAEALVWFGKAAAQGSSNAEFNMGEMYLEGKGVEPDRATAVEHLRRAAGLGHEHARAKLRELGYE